MDGVFETVECTDELFSGGGDVEEDAELGMVSRSD